MSKRLVILLILLLGIALTASCSGGGGNPLPPDFTRMTARVTGTDGAPLADLVVRVEGRSTGVTTNANGEFTLEAGAFPNGVTNSNELSFGRNGIVLATYEVIPADSPEPTITFGDGSTGDPGSLSGMVYDETTEQPLDAVELNLYSPEGGVFITASADGAYEFAEVPEGTWQLVANKEGYRPEIAVVEIVAGQETVQHLALTPEGAVTPGDGLKVKGVLRDSVTNEPVAGALVTMYADNGYMGICDTGLKNDVGDWTDANSGGGSTGAEPGVELMTRGVRMAPWGYDPSYQETTTGADGSFEFENEVIGYTLWMNMTADNYLPGNYYEDITNKTGELNLDLTIEPFIPTSVSGTVKDEDGNPVSGAYVEYIYAGDWGNEIGIAVPGGMPMEDVATESRDAWDEYTTPPPPMAGGMEGSNGWAEYMDAPEPPSDAGGAPNVDNQMLQKFRWDNKNGGHGASDATPFNGYFGMTTGEDGTYSFEGMPTGQYYIFASAYRHEAYNSDVTLAEDPAENVIDISLPNIPVGSVEGTITDETGASVPDALVNCTQPNVDPFTYTDANGHFQIDNVPEGTWIVSAYKQGFLTVGIEVEIVADQVASGSIQIEHYVPETPVVITYSGHTLNGTDASGIEGADMVFTPVDNNYGGWFQHVISGSGGDYTAELIPTEYNVLLQKSGYQDLYIRIWVDSLYPTMDFMLWPIGGGNGPWGGPIPMMGSGGAPTVMPERGEPTPN